MKREEAEYYIDSSSTDERGEPSMWSVFNAEGQAIDYEWDDEEDATEICEFMNEAFRNGKLAALTQEPSIPTEPGDYDMIGQFRVRVIACPLQACGRKDAVKCPFLMVDEGYRRTCIIDFYGATFRKVGE